MGRAYASRSARRVRPDAKGRVSLGRLAKDVSSFRVGTDSEGRIWLEPYAEVPAREKWLFENPEALARVKRGLADSAAGRTKAMGGFSRYVDGKSGRGGR